MSKEDKRSTKPECGAKARGDDDATSDTHGGSRLMTTDGAKQISNRGGVRYSTKPNCGAKTNEKFNGGRSYQRRAG